MAQEPVNYNSTSDDNITESGGILVMDESGQFKVLINGELKDFKGAAKLEFSKIQPVEEIKRAVPSPFAVPVTAEDKMQTAMMDTGKEELMLQPPPPALISKKSTFYFHPEDEEEAASHKFNSAGLGPQKKYSLDKILIKIIDNYKLKLSESQKTRLRKAIFSFLRETRTIIDTVDVLKRNDQEGGLNLPAETVASLSEFLKEVKNKINQEGGEVIDERLEEAKTSVKYLRPKEPFKKPLSKSEPQVLPTSDLNRGVKPVPHLSQSVSGISPKEPFEPVKKEPVINKLPFKNSQLRRPPAPRGKQVDDVKRELRLVGPVDELAKLNLETFRRLGQDTASRAAKIISKINSLQDESLAKKAAGIKAWRQSPLHKMYVSLGQASMENSISVEEIIKQYASSGKEIITFEEFEAISDINRKLRF